MRRGLVVSLAVVLLVAGGSFAAAVLTGSSPELGLDLQGGASVVLRPTRPVSTGVLDQSIGVIRNRVDALGVAEPDISRQGRNIIVQLPGVKNRDRALAIVGQTAELRFRPVIGTALGLSQVVPAKKSGRASPAAGQGATTTTLPGGKVQETPREDDKADREVVLPQIVKGEVERYWRLGPAELTGEIIQSASPSSTGIPAPGWCASA